MHINKFTDDCGYGDYYSDDPDRPGDVRVRLDGEDVLAFIRKEVNRYRQAPRDLWDDGIYAMSIEDRLAYDIATAHWDDDVYIVVYDVGDAYGGPEEGGWWFTTYRLEEATKVEADSWEARLRIIEHLLPLKQRNWKNQEFGQRGSFGDWARYAVVVEVIPQGDEPGAMERNQTRPTYC